VVSGRACLLAMLLVAATPIARADVYGYVDANGTVHLATEKLDDRYALFLKARDGSPTVGIDTDGPDHATDPALMRTRLFQHLVDHPNIAKYEPMIRAASKRRGLDPNLVKAVIAVESGFDPNAVSDKGAVGLMQVLPATGERYGVRAERKKSVGAKLADPKLNLEIGTRYLSDLRGMFPERLDLALAAYNAGENAVLRFHRAVPPFPETQAYVKLVDQFHAFYRPPQGPADAVNRIRVMIPARRNLPDPGVPLRFGTTPVPAATPPVIIDDTSP
jgi:hypothetical protein